MNYAVVGTGRMGRAIEGEAGARGHRCVARVGRGELSRAPLDGAEVVFEFTEATSVEANLRQLLESGHSVICGTTGFEPSPELSALASARNCGLVIAPNFSVGMQIFYRLVAEASRSFAGFDGFDPFVLEHHHRGKRDAPSGTALRLARLVVDENPRLERIEVERPEGRLPSGTVPVSAIRAGGEPGRHLVGFDGAHETIRLSHRARGREVFAHGAVLAAEWLGKRSGYHSFEFLVQEALELQRRET